LPCHSLGEAPCKAARYIKEEKSDKASKTQSDFCAHVFTLCALTCTDVINDAKKFMITNLKLLANIEHCTD